ncbi:hypothetical protein ACJW30_02G008400 [Castanea mollissima]
MAYTKMEMGLVLVLVTMLWAGASAQSSCTNVIISCCSQLASVVRSQPQCLCQVLNGGSSSLGININQTQALALPGACNVQTPPLSSCNAASPSNSPAGSPTSSDSGSGSKTVPSTEGSTSAGSSFKLSISHLFFLICAATVASTFTAY